MRGSKTNSTVELSTQTFREGSEVELGSEKKNGVKKKKAEKQKSTNEEGN